MASGRPARLIGVRDVPTDRPIVLLDVDGVLNAYDHGIAPSPWQPKVESDPIPYEIDREATIVLPAKRTAGGDGSEKREYRIAWSSELADELARAADDGLVTLLWLTSWNSDAGLLSDELLWPGRPSPILGYLDSKGDAERTTFATKNVVMRRVCDAVASSGDRPVPVIAFDDDMPWDSLMWGIDAEFPPFFHGIGTNPAYGITRSQWRHALGVCKADTDADTDAE